MYVVIFRTLVKPSVEIWSPARRQLSKIFSGFRKLHHRLYVCVPPKVRARLFEVGIPCNFWNMVYNKRDLIFSCFAGHRYVFNDRSNAAALTRVNRRRDRGRPRSVRRRRCRRRKRRRRFLSQRRRRHRFKRSLSERRRNGLQNALAERRRLLFVWRRFRRDIRRQRFRRLRRRRLFGIIRRHWAPDLPDHNVAVMILVWTIIHFFCLKIN